MNRRETSKAARKILSEHDIAARVTHPGRGMPPSAPGLVQVAKHQVARAEQLIKDAGLHLDVAADVDEDL